MLLLSIRYKAFSVIRPINYRITGNPSHANITFIKLPVIRELKQTSDTGWFNLRKIIMEIK